MKPSRSPFLVIKTVKEKGVPWLETIENVPAEEDLHFGVSRVKGFPRRAAFSMSDDYRKDSGLADAFKNVSSLLVVSARLLEGLKAVPGALFRNEVLPVKLFDHQKRAVKAAYSIIHQVNHPDCLDEARSQGVRMAINPGQFQFMTTLVLEEKKIEPKRMLFRVASFPNVVLIRRDLAEKLSEGKFTGIEFHEIAGFNFLLA